MQLQGEVLAVVTAETDAQKEAGLSVAARTDCLLSSFENATGFMKRMNACELWSITKGVDLLDLVIPWSREETKAWNYQDGLPAVPPWTEAKPTTQMRPSSKHCGTSTTEHAAMFSHLCKLRHPSHLGVLTPTF